MASAVSVGHSMTLSHGQHLLCAVPLWGHLQADGLEAT